MRQTDVSQRVFNILLVEDNEDDVYLTKRAFGRLPYQTRFFVANDGAEALEFLRRGGRDHDSPRPDLILLDLNMPRMDGRELLEAIKQDRNLRSIPTIILTTSDAEDDIQNAYDGYANAYVTKEAVFGQFSSSVERFANCWLALVELPAGVMRAPEDAYTLLGP